MCQLLETGAEETVSLPQKACKSMGWAMSILWETGYMYNKYTPSCNGTGEEK